MYFLELNSNNCKFLVIPKMAGRHVRGMALTKESAVMLVAVILTLMLGRVGSVGLRWDLVLVKLEVGNNHTFH